MLDTRMACFLVIIAEIGSWTLWKVPKHLWFFEALNTLKFSPGIVPVRVIIGQSCHGWQGHMEQVHKEQFPLSVLHTCSLHTLQAFCREVSGLKLWDTKREQEKSRHPAVDGVCKKWTVPGAACTDESVSIIVRSAFQCILTDDTRHEMVEGKLFLGLPTTRLKAWTAT